VQYLTAIANRPAFGTDGENVFKVKGNTRVFRFAGATAFVGYSLALLQNSIWYKRNWAATLKSMFDGLIYALFTEGIFGWLWPV
jgi:hypothetical protein